MVKDITDGFGHNGWLRTQRMVDDTIDRDPEYIFHHPNVFKTFCYGCSNLRINPKSKIQKKRHKKIINIKKSSNTLATNSTPITDGVKIRRSKIILLLLAPTCSNSFQECDFQKNPPTPSAVERAGMAVTNNDQRVQEVNSNPPTPHSGRAC